MPNYKRYYTSNAYYFFTVVTYKRQPIFQDINAIQLLKESIQTIKQKYPFTIEAIVILPDHIHCVWKMNEKDVYYSKRWQFIKMYFSKQYKKEDQSTITPTSSRFFKREKTIWQRRFWEHRIRNEKDLYQHFDYIHYNPVKHGYVNNPKDWEWSTFHKFVENGWYDSEWGMCEPKSISKDCVGE